MLAPRLQRDGSRLLTCNGPCGERVNVYEVPGPFLDPDIYVCGKCLVGAQGG